MPHQRTVFNIASYKNIEKKYSLKVKNKSVIDCISENLYMFLR